MMTAGQILYEALGFDDWANCPEPWVKNYEKAARAVIEHDRAEQLAAAENVARFDNQQSASVE